MFITVWLLYCGESSVMEWPYHGESRATEYDGEYSYGIDCIVQSPVLKGDCTMESPKL